jgi:hypothetical protein
MEPDIHLDLNADEAHTLHDLLRDTLPDLRREVARTDHHDFRHELVRRQELCERLIAKLEAGEAR